MAEFETLKKPAEFRHIYDKGVKGVTKSFVAFAYFNPDREITAMTLSVKYGVVASKKVGNAVRRNRAKRRLREAFRLSGLKVASSKFNYVFVARQDVLHYPFIQLKDDMVNVIEKLNRKLNR